MRLGRAIMAALYVAAGAMHFIVPQTYMRIVPDYLPAHRPLVLISGAAEIAAGIGLLLPQTRRAAAWGLIVLLIAVFPANIAMVTEHARFPSVPLWAAWARLPLQIPLLYWAWLYTRRSDDRLAAIRSDEARPISR